MNPIQNHNVKVTAKSAISKEVHETTEAKRLKDSCQQFESILWAQIWKKMRATSRSMGGQNESGRPWKQMEDLSVEMASEELAKSGGAGLWKVLYDQMIPSVAAKTAEKDDGADGNA